MPAASRKVSIPVLLSLLVDISFFLVPYLPFSLSPCNIDVQAVQRVGLCFLMNIFPFLILSVLSLVQCLNFHFGIVEIFSTTVCNMQTLDCAMYTRCLILDLVFFSFVFASFFFSHSSYCIVSCWFTWCFYCMSRSKNQKLTFRIISKLSVKHIVCRWLYFISVYFTFFSAYHSFVLTVRLTYVRICRIYRYTDTHTHHIIVFTFEFTLGVCIHFLSSFARSFALLSTLFGMKTKQQQQQKIYIRISFCIVNRNLFFFRRRL